MILHNYFRSSTSVRLRAALNLKGLGYDYVSYALLKDETKHPDYLAMNPAGLVPSLELDDGTSLVQSLAIIEWLDETYPAPPLLPRDPMARAHARALAYMVACEIHPLNNLRVLKYITTTFGANETAKTDWFRNWVVTTFDALETTLAQSNMTGRYCVGDTPGLADLCLYAQVWNNARFQIETSNWPTIAGIFDRLEALPAFADAAPARQPDAV